ncbi:MAG: tetratricopeptide repeat protein, partial [Planctomycetota bacterium]
MHPLPTALSFPVILAVLTLPSAVWGGDIPELTPQEEALVAGRFAQAAAGFEQLSRDASGSPEGEKALYRAARAWFLAEDAKKAKAALETFLGTYPDSPLRYKARALLSRAASALGDPVLAARILEEELTNLSGKKTRRAVASLLQREAGRLRQLATREEGERPTGKPHPSDLAAMNLLEKAKALTGSDASIDLALASLAMKVKNHGRAAVLLEGLFNAAGRTDPRLALELGNAFYHGKRSSEAREVLNPFLDEWKDSSHAPAGLDLLARSCRSSYGRLRAYKILFERYGSHALAP